MEQIHMVCVEFKKKIDRFINKVMDDWKRVRNEV